MNARERVMAAVSHKQPDYVQLDLGGTPSSGISAIAYNNLKEYLNLTEGHTRIYDVVEQVVQPEDEILDRFGVDVLDIGSVFNENDSDWYDNLNPVQTTVYQMDPKSLKTKFGKDITFWGGGCNTRSILNRSTAQEVYDYSKRMIDIFADGGGFIFNQEHNIMPDVPPENIIAMYQAVADSRK